MKKKIPKEITLDNLEKTAIKYLEKYTASEKQLKDLLKRKIIKTSFFFKKKPEKDFNYINLIIDKFKKIGLIDDKKFAIFKASSYLEKGFSKRKIVFYLKNKGLSDENIKFGISNLEKSFFNYELVSALIFSRKKKIINFKKKKNDEIKKDLMRIAQAGFSYEVAKKIVDIKNEEEYFNLEKYANTGKN